MSSDDDDQEEELLQRALQEQAQRNLQYKRPSNYPPPVISAAAAGPPIRQPPRPSARQFSITPPRRDPPKPLHAEEEEESDVELLSISSEEEDDPQTRRASVHASADAKKVSKARDEDSDLEWDNGANEPDKWTRVDEAELVRRVREMRETRSAPTANQAHIRRAAPVGSEAFPRGEDFLDPLGLGTIDVKTLTLATGGVHSSHSTMALEKVDIKKGAGSKVDDGATSPPQTPASRDHVLREEITYHSDKFEPKRFLSHIHQNTTAADLEAGEQALKMDLQNRKHQLKQLVKENFDCFVSCKSTIDDIHSKLQQIEQDPEGAGTTHLSHEIHDVDKVASRAFGALFERQVQAERIRSVQGMLQRFRTLFNLPSTIRSNISKGEYDLAVREYKKAKSIVLPTHAGILQKVLEEVEKVVQEFKDKLYKSMEDPQLELSQLESTVRLLLELDPGSDPVWYYLSIQSHKILGLQEGCSFEYGTQINALRGRIKAKVESDARWKKLQRESSKAAEVDYSLLLGEQEQEMGETDIKESIGDESDALLFQLIRRLTAVVVHHVPTFWRLAVAIFNGKFAKGGSVNGTLESGVYKAALSGKYINGEKAADMKCSNHSLDEVVDMVTSIISLYESKVLNAFLALGDSNVQRPYMRDAVEEISKACLTLENKDFAPSSAVQTMFTLRTEVTRLFILRMCSFMRAATSDIVNAEDWVPVSTIECGNSQFAISSLPLHFRSMLMSSMGLMIEYALWCIGLFIMMDWQSS
eukprot:c28676_g1_i1 orf=1854-4124(-)